MFREVNLQNHALVYRISVVACFILFAAVVRILPHPWNFTPVGAMALFSGAKLGRSWQAFLFPLIALFCGDLFVGFHRLMPVVYFSFCISVLIGIAFRQRQSLKLLSAATFLGALQFFLITNFGIWALENFYPRSLAGLTTCFIAAIPYFGNTLAGDSFYALVLFGGFALLERFSPALSRTGPSSLPGYGD
ncbi:MAG: DUF6580 family putative transport protein [Candidatus Acidiferrum sp.]|jgi:hypothetical protein